MNKITFVVRCAPGALALASLFITDRVQRPHTPTVFVQRTPTANQALLTDLQLQIVGEPDLAFALSDRPVAQVRADIVEPGRGLHVVLFAKDVARGVRNARTLAGRIAGPVQSTDLQTEVEQSHRVRVLWREGEHKVLESGSFLFQSLKQL